MLSGRNKYPQGIKKVIGCVVILHFTIVGFGQLNSKETIVNKYLKQSDAEIILGQAASLTESSTEEKDGVIKYRCTYTANKKESGTGNTGHLYYVFEKYEGEALAKDVFADILSQNDNMPNLKIINNIGDEALSHTDNQNFSLLVVRRRDVIIRLKINRLTNMTSVLDLQRIAEQIVNHL